MLKINIVNEKMLNADKENIIDLLNENFNNPVLNKLYFIPKKINKNIINTKLNTVEYISKVLKTINFYRHKDIKKLISDKMSRFEKGTSYKINAGKLYIIIGLDTTTIYSINNNITVLLLESTDGIEDKLDILLAHEYTHFIRKQIFKQDIKVYLYSILNDELKEKEIEKE